MCWKFDSKSKLLAALEYNRLPGNLIGAAEQVRGTDRFRRFGFKGFQIKGGRSVAEQPIRTIFVLKAFHLRGGRSGICMYSSVQ